MSAPRRVVVLLVAPSLRFFGGQAIQAQRLQALLGSSEAIEVRFLPVDPRLPGPLAPLQSIKFVRTIVTTIAYVASLLRAVPRADVIHAFSASYWSFLLAPLPALLVARAFGKPSILNYRSGEAEDHLARWATGRWGVAQATEIIVPSGYLVDVFRRFGRAARAIPNVVDFSPGPPRPAGPLPPRLLANRNFVGLYNVACCVRAFARVQARHPEARLVLAGDGPERPALEALVGTLGLRQVEFVGQVPPGQMAARLAETGIYLNSSRIDNMPTSILEAFMAGVPVVSTAVGGIPYIAEHGRTARLVADDDDAALAAEVLDLLAHPDEARAMAERARADSEARYAPAAIARAWEAAYLALARRR